MAAPSPDSPPHLHKHSRLLCLALVLGLAAAPLACLSSEGSPPGASGGTSGQSGTGGAPTTTNPCAGTSQCTTSCAVREFESVTRDIREKLPETLVPMPSTCRGRTRPPDGTFEGENTINEGFDLVVELRNGVPQAIDDVPCVRVFPDETQSPDLCIELYQCGCCFFEFGPSLSATGWGLRPDKPLGSTYDCPEFPPGIFKIGGDWVPPTSTPTPPVTDECSGYPDTCCNLCYDECRICDSIRDIECWRDCYSECRGCCRQCGL